MLRIILVILVVEAYFNYAKLNIISGDVSKKHGLIVFSRIEVPNPELYKPKFATKLRTPSDL